jgi:hypothetical protein
MPNKQPNTTGRVAQVRLPPGSYQLGLLVLDSSAGSAIAQKNVLIAGPQGSSSGSSGGGLQPDYEDDPEAGSSGGSSQSPKHPN